MTFIQFVILTDHPNCLIFISHSGLLSFIEAMHFGVPLIGVPISFDQILNAKRAAVSGYSIIVQMNYNLSIELKFAILGMLKNKKVYF